MNEKLVRIRLFSLVLLLLCSALVWLGPLIGRANSDNLLQVHFLDVGQGDSIFIESPTGVQVLIDGGRDNIVLQRLATQMSFFDRNIDMIVATHPDSDHVSGLIDVLGRYQVSQILMTENESDTKTFESLKTAIKNEGSKVTMARRGQVFDLGGGVTMRVLYPETNPKDLESNTSSIVVQVIYGENEFMLTGDSPKNIEEYLVLAEGESLQSDVLKAGHHGSRTSTSELWLETVDPQFAVISAGKDNRYGHPHVEVTDTLFNHQVETHSTAEEGTITFLSDGSKVWLR